MEHKYENNLLTIYLTGNIDSNNAGTIEEEIEKICSKYELGPLTIDAKDLHYISSAGLRIILRLKKSHKEFKVINVSSEIYEIFDMTGFTDMMDIEKAYRQLSVDGCEAIGEGSNGVVYRINDDTIIKVYKNNDALESIKRERELARTALVLGINTAIPYDVVMVGDKYGSVFELLSAKSLTKYIIAEPDKMDEYVKIFAGLLKEIHETNVKPGTLPSAKTSAVTWVEYLKDVLPVNTYDKLLGLVHEIPECDTMIHGDYHTNNVHYANGETILIDMDTLSVGHPIIELACMFNTYVGFSAADHENIEKFMKMKYDMAQVVWKKTLQFYLDSTDEKLLADVETKARVLGYCRILRRSIKRNIPGDEKLREIAKQEIIDGVEKIDSFIF